MGRWVGCPPAGLGGKGVDSKRCERWGARLRNHHSNCISSHVRRDILWTIETNYNAFICHRDLHPYLQSNVDIQAVLKDNVWLGRGTLPACYLVLSSTAAVIKHSFGSQLLW